MVERIFYYIFKISVALDQLVNTFLDGYPDETLSSRMYVDRNRSKINYILYKVTNLIFFWQKDHCKEAYESEINRSHLSYKYRNIK